VLCHRFLYATVLPRSIKDNQNKCNYGFNWQEKKALVTAGDPTVSPQQRAPYIYVSNVYRTSLRPGSWKHHQNPNITVKVYSSRETAKDAREDFLDEILEKGYNLVKTSVNDICQ